MIRKLKTAAVEFLNSPMRVLIVCAAFGFLVLVLDGTLFRLWNLHREARRIESNIARLSDSTRALEMQIKKAKEIEFVERQARDRFDLVGEDDLVFVFTNESD
ncbi:MAG TPA: septum formation initiator family protein [Bdellovibrionales bacterium]|nr:septum formation initiator family protein [Bdellovibrionales bacterium]